MSTEVQKEINDIIDIFILYRIMIYGLPKFIGMLSNGVSLWGPTNLDDLYQFINALLIKGVREPSNIYYRYITDQNNFDITSYKYKGRSLEDTEKDHTLLKNILSSVNEIVQTNNIPDIIKILVKSPLTR